MQSDYNGYSCHTCYAEIYFSLYYHIATKLDRTLTKNGDLPSIKSNDPFIKWYCETTWQTENIISPLSRVSIATKFDRIVY